MKAVVSRSLRASVLMACFAMISLFALPSIASSQPRYRTFNQDDLALKKAKKAGKSIGSLASFTFRNDSSYAVTSLHVKFNSDIQSIIDSGGFSTFAVSNKHELDATGGTVAGHSSVAMEFRFSKKGGDLKAAKWWWDTSGVKIGKGFSKDLHADSVTAILGEPNGGTTLEYLYKHIIQRPAGLVVGIAIPDSASRYGWIRYKKADSKYFPHTDSARCFDLIADGMGNTHPFLGEIKNPHVKKHNNHLLGQLHALMLAIVANDSGVAAPFDSSTRLGNLLYNAAGSDPCNGLKVRQIALLADSALTFCGRYPAALYADLDSCISKIIRAFDGPYVAVTFAPLTLAGTNTLPAFLTGSATPEIPHFQHYTALDDAPAQYELRQNYPNPFNPTTTIEFTLSAPSLVSLKVYNILGQEVATLIDRQSMEDGDQSIDFNAGALPTGVYFARMTAQSLDDSRVTFQSVRRMLLIR